MVTSFELIRAALFRACFWPPFQKSTGLGCFITQSQFSREEEAAWQAHGSLVKKNSWYAKLGWHGVRVFQLKKGIFEYWICVLVVPLSMVPSPCRQSSNKNKAAHVRWNISSSELQMHGPKFSSRGNPSISSLSLSLCIYKMYIYWSSWWLTKRTPTWSFPAKTNLLRIAVKGHQANTSWNYGLRGTFWTLDHWTPLIYVKSVLVYS